MLKRITVLFIFIVSLGWIAYIAVDISRNGNDYNEIYLFDNKDEAVLIVNRPMEVRFNMISEMAESPLFELMQALNPSAYSTGFFSLKRSHMLIETNQPIDDPQQLNALFPEHEVKHLPNGTFTIGALQGKYRKQRIYIYSKNLSTTAASIAPFKFDSKASAALIQLAAAAEKRTIRDIYFKPSGNVDFITRNTDAQLGNQVRDEPIFAGAISHRFDTYHFFERDYYISTDSVFSNGPMATWIHHGFVELDYAGTTAIISDYIGGQDPVLMLNDLEQRQDAQQFSVPLTQRFPKKGEPYFIKYLDDLVVISTSEDVCDQLIAEYKLGNTIALNADVQQKVYGDLPQLVSERFITKESKSSKAIYNGYTLETVYGTTLPLREVKKESIALPCNFEIQDFATLPDLGNVIASGKKGELVYFKDEKERWRKDLGASPVGTVQTIDLHGSGEQHFLITTKEAIHIFDTLGREPAGYPVKLNEIPLSEATFYRWKGKSYLLLNSSNQQVYHFDAQGRELNIIRPEYPCEEKIDVWASQGRLFAGFRGNGNFEMYEIEKQKPLRSFPVPIGSFSGKTHHELLHFGVSDGKIRRLDQKGSPTVFESISADKIVTVENNNRNPILIVQKMNLLKLVNQDGIVFGETRIPFNEIGSVGYHVLNSGETIVSIVDELENNIYFYSVDGSQMFDKSKEGKIRCDLDSHGNYLKTTTIVDQYVIQYLEN